MERPRGLRGLADLVPAMRAVPPAAGARVFRQGWVRCGGATRENLLAGCGDLVQAPARGAGRDAGKDAVHSRYLRQGGSSRGAGGSGGGTKQ